MVEDMLRVKEDFYKDLLKEYSRNILYFILKMDVIILNLKIYMPNTLIYFEDRSNSMEKRVYIVEGSAIDEQNNILIGPREIFSSKIKISQNVIIFSKIIKYL